MKTLLKSIYHRVTKNIKPFCKYYKKPIIMLSVIATLVLSTVAISGMCAKNIGTFNSTTFAAEAPGPTITKGDPKTAHPTLYDAFYGSDGSVRKSIEQICQGNRYKGIAQKLSVTVGESGSVTLADGITIDKGIMNGVNNTLVMIGMFIALVTWGYGLFNQILRSGERAGITLVNNFVHLIIVLALVINGRNLMFFTVNTGTALTDKLMVEMRETDYSGTIDKVVAELAEKTLGNTYSKEEYIDSLEKHYEKEFEEKYKENNKKSNWFTDALNGFSKLLSVKIAGNIKYYAYVITDTAACFWGCLGQVIDLAIPKLATWIADCCVQILVYSRALEILIMCSFAPIAFGFMNEHGLAGSAGMRYWKNIIALALQGVIILVIMRMTSGIIIGFLSTEMENLTFINVVIMSWVEVAMVKKSLDMCRQVVGLG